MCLHITNIHTGILTDTVPSSELLSNQITSLRLQQSSARTTTSIEHEAVSMPADGALTRSGLLYEGNFDE